MRRSGRNILPEDTRVSLGLNSVERANLKQKCSKYQWDDELQLLWRCGNQNYSDRLVPDLGEQVAIVKEAH